MKTDVLKIETKNNYVQQNVIEPKNSVAKGLIMPINLIIFLPFSNTLVSSAYNIVYRRSDTLHMSFM